MTEELEVKEIVLHKTLCMEPAPVYNMMVQIAREMRSANEMFAAGDIIKIVCYRPCGAPND